MHTGQGYVLIVEDDPDILTLLDTTLKIADHHVVTANNGRDALEIIRGEHPTIVIADIMMPYMDGYGLVNRLKIDPATRHIPAVFITATFVSPEDREFALKIGVARILPKPLNLRMFLDTVEELLSGRARVPAEAFDEFHYYDAYRRLMEGKLEQKTRQIARDERLLWNRSNSDVDLRDSLRHAVRDRAEIESLLSEIQKQLERVDGQAAG
jgi:CheY-like chemotaxis protein